MTALAQFLKRRMAELDLDSYEDVARRTRSFDQGINGKGRTGLDADTVRRIALGERRTIHDRTLHLLAAALTVPPRELRAVAEDRSADEVLEYRVPREAHGELMTSRLHHAWTENIRAIHEALDGVREIAYRDGDRAGYQRGYAEALRAHGLVEDPVAVAEAMGADSLPAS